MERSVDACYVPRHHKLRNNVLCLYLQVLLDNVNIQSLDTQWLRSITGLVGQDPVLFNGTILENILYGNPEATIQDVS